MKNKKVLQDLGVTSKSEQNFQFLEKCALLFSGALNFGTASFI